MSVALNPLFTAMQYMCNSLAGFQGGDEAFWRHIGLWASWLLEDVCLCVSDPSFSLLYFVPETGLYLDLGIQ